LFIYIPERIEELQELLETSRKEYDALKKELALVEEGKLDDKLDEICKRIDEYNFVSIFFKSNISNSVSL
jgi:hypothetical protein